MLGTRMGIGSKLRWVSAGFAVMALALGWTPARAGYKSADQLKSEFAAFLGKDKSGNQRYARLAWFHALGTNKHDWDEGNTHIYVMDTKDGTPRKLTGSFGDTAGTLFQPSVTMDGRRVVFSDESANIWVINWDGTGLRKLMAGWNLSRIWRDPSNNTDWAVVASNAQSNRGQTGYKSVYRVNIDDTTQKVLVWSKTEMDSQKWGFWASLSGDGKRVGGTFPWNLIGWGEAGDGALHFIGVDTVMKGTQGCWTTMAKDNSYNILATVNDHWAARVWFSATGKDSIAWIVNGRKGLPAGGRQGVFNYLRWSNDQDIVTSSFENDQQLNIGPVAQSLSNVYKFVDLQDGNNPFTAGNCDLWIYADGTDFSAAPNIINPGNLNIDVGKAADILVNVNGVPAPTLTATGLPAGLAVVAGDTPANSFHIKGTPTAASSSTVTLKATNSKGNDQKAFTLQVSAGNQAPKVDAGADFNNRVNRAIALAGTITDDGKPNPNPTAQWKQVLGPGTTTFDNAKSAITNATASKPGVYKYELAAYDGALYGYDTIQVTVLDSLPFKVLHPAAGEQVAIGATFNVQWQLDPAEGVNLYLSTDGGKSWNSITPAGAVGTDGTTSYAWKVADTLKPSAQCLLKVEHYFVHSIVTQSGTFSLVKGTGAVARGVAYGPGFNLRSEAAGLRLEVAPGAPVTGVRLIGAGGQVAWVRSWDGRGGHAEALRLPPGLYVGEWTGPGFRQGFLLPILP